MTLPDPMHDDLAKTLALVAGDLDAKGYPLAGVVRAAACALLTTAPTNTDGCRRCSKPLTYSGRGRPRVWCDEQCRRGKARK